MQRGKINKYGMLQIKRRGIYKNQMCFNNPDADVPCGDWCPAFEEFERDFLLVKICIRKTEIKIIEDSREKEEN